HDAQFGTDTFAGYTGKQSGPYLEMLRAWVRDGRGALPEDEVRRLAPAPTRETQLARAERALAWHLHQVGRAEGALRHFRRAGEEFSADPRARSEGYRAITRWLVYATQQEIEAGDPRFPGFVSHQNPWNQWGGPNPDNVYLRANIDPQQSYRVWTRDARGLRQ